MIGTPTIRNIVYDANPHWGPTCNYFLKQIKSHSSIASQSYYLKIHLQYFYDIFHSLMEIDRILRRGGDCVIVVQDSYYKEIHNDLASIVTEMVANFRWQVVASKSFPVRLIMNRLNNSSRRYRASSNAVESVLWFKSPKS